MFESQGTPAFPSFVFALATSPSEAVTAAPVLTEPVAGGVTSLGEAPPIARSVPSSSALLHTAPREREGCPCAPDHSAAALGAQVIDPTESSARARHLILSEHGPDGGAFGFPLAGVA